MMIATHQRIERGSMFSFKNLVDSLYVEQLDTYLFRGFTLKLPLPQVYGGQVLAQSLNAATRTVAEDRIPHSLHAYFLRRGDQDKPIIYDVDPIRDGGSFSTRRVVAKQNGKAIFNCSISFQALEKGLEHQMAMPDGVPMPEELEVDKTLASTVMPGFKALDAVKLAFDGVVGIRPTNPRGAGVEGMEPVRGFWMKFNEALADDSMLHRTMLSYISDWGLMGTALYPQPTNIMEKGIQAASLDHAMWFHADFRLDDWVYYHMDSPVAAHGRGFNRGSFYTREGVLIASCAQEGLMRLKK